MAAPSSADPPPALWNPIAAARWSLLFSPAFGAYLHACNADTLGRAEEAKAHRIWFYVALVFLGLDMLGALMPVIPDNFFLMGSLVLLFAWYVSLGRKQIRYVKDTWQDRYQRKSWTTPLLIGVAGWVAFSLIDSILAFHALSMLNVS